MLSRSELERLLCRPSAMGAIDDLLPRNADAWSGAHPSLDAFADFPPGESPVRVCIATEQITGPVRNGGIGTTYGHLAELLARDGHDVTVLYLRGRQVEVETVEHWIDWYANKGVRFVPVPDYAYEDQFQSNSDRWLRVPYNMMRYLIDHPMDVVHVSEWRGTGYLSLLAKRQALAFADTLFVVKTSSPWMWNRLYGSHTLERTDDLVKVAAERKSVELADIAIGGSHHLLRWMASQGYAIPEGRAFVQPNVSTFTALEPLMSGRADRGGQRTPIDEFVFFGRLEARKGLFVFCQAIRRLIRKGVPLPPKITFMGKPGGRMASHPDQATPEYIEAVSRDWPTQVSILTEFQQQQAIEYLLNGPRLAVMPSIIENSSMAIYETAICGIPTVASNVGGNPELILPDDHPSVLCDPHPIALGEQLERALAEGGMVPRPSFDNDANLATWCRFHRQLAGPLRRELLTRSRAAHATVRRKGTTAVCLYCPGSEAALAATLASLAAQSHRPAEVLVAVDAEHPGAVANANALLETHGFAGTAVEAFDLDAGAAFNVLAKRARADYLLFLWEGATLIPTAIATLEFTARTGGTDVLTWFHRVRTPGDDAASRPLRAVVLCSASDSFFREDSGELPLFVRRKVHAVLGGFTNDYRVLGYDHEFVAAAQLAGIDCQTLIAALGTVQARTPEWIRAKGYDLSASTFRNIRPELAAAPLAIRDVLLLARGLAQRGPLMGARKPDDPIRKAEGMLTRMLAGIPHGQKSAEVGSRPNAKRVGRLSRR